MESADQPISLDPNAVIDELVQMPEGRTLWALAQERAARKQLQTQLAEAGRRLAELENAQAPTTPPSTSAAPPDSDG